MDDVGVIAVVGACEPERFGYAIRLAKATGREFIPARRLAGLAYPAHEAAMLALWTGPAGGAVVEFADHVVATEVIGAFTDVDERVRLQELICVVDATHLLDDLHRDDYLPVHEGAARAEALFIARAQLTVTQLEYASTIVLVNWRALATLDLATIMALVSHLSPLARLQLHRDTPSDSIDRINEATAYTVEQDRPGWMGILNSDFDPHMTDRRISAFRYEQPRPLHPGRLLQLLDERIEPGEFGTVVRSAGFCRLATRPGIVAQWEHVGRVITLSPLADDGHLADDTELLALGQDLALIGLDLDHHRFIAALDDAALTDAEFAAGPAAWATFADDFPSWAAATNRTE